MYVDQVSIVSYTQVSEPPLAPSGLQIDGSTHAAVDLSFTDNADDEWGFEVWRASSDLGANCRNGLSVGTLSASEGVGGSVSFRDDGVSPETPYWYFATAFNSGGDSGCSAGQSVLTGAAPDLSLDSLNAYKVKGAHTVDLAWTAPEGAAVDVWRDGAPVPGLENLSGSSVTDAIGAKGGGSYSYEVCLTGTTTCSNTLVATF